MADNKIFEQLLDECEKLKQYATRASVELDELKPNLSPRKYQRHEKELNKYMKKYLDRVADMNPNAMKIIFSLAYQGLKGYLESEKQGK